MLRFPKAIARLGVEHEGGLGRGEGDGKEGSDRLPTEVPTFVRARYPCHEPSKGSFTKAERKERILSFDGTARRPPVRAPGGPWVFCMLEGRPPFAQRTGGSHAPHLPLPPAHGPGG